MKILNAQCAKLSEYGSRNVGLCRPVHGRDQLVEMLDYIYNICLFFQVNVELLGNTGDGLMSVDPSLWQQNVSAPQVVPETVTVTLTQNPGEGQC